LPAFWSNASTSIFDHVEARLAKGRTFEDISQGKVDPGDPDTALWLRLPGHLEPSAASLAIIGDYVTGGLAQSVGRPTTARSLDNTIRVVRLEPTEWVLCDIRIQALVDGFAQGVAYLWSERGALLATASQSMSARLWDQAGTPRQIATADRQG
jgi:acyl-CoA thioesterase